MTELSLQSEKLSDIFEKIHILGLPFDAVLHKFTEPDTGDPHDHPYFFTSFILKGGYIEEVFTIHSSGDWSSEIIERKPGTSHKVHANHIHQIISLPEGECWTLILPEKWEQKSGFYRFEENGVKFRFWDEKNFREI